MGSLAGLFPGQKKYPAATACSYPPGRGLNMLDFG